MTATSTPSASITILRSDTPLAKPIAIGEDGVPVVGRVKMGFLFDVKERTVAGLNDLHEMLQDLQYDQHATVIRGKLIEGRSTEAVRRISRDQSDSLRNFEPCSRQWLMVDVDELPLPAAWSDVYAHADDIIAVALKALPPEFQDAACVYQWSNSMGFKQGLIRVHLWFWLDKAISDDEAKAWLDGYPVDPALYNPVQPHYTANPILAEGVTDPIVERVGLYVPDGATDIVKVPDDLSHRAIAVTAPRRHRNPSGAIDPQALVRDPGTGLVTDGRELFLLLKSNDATKELLRERNDKSGYPSADAIAERTWALFSAETDLADGKWTKEHAQVEAKRRKTELETGTYSFVSRSEVTTLEPAAGPFVDLDLVTPDEAADRLDAALGGFFSKTEEAPRMALRITMGAGKTRGTIQQLQPWLAQQYGKQVEIYVPRHDLADQYIQDLKAIDGGICAEIIHHYPRTGGAKGDLPILCLRPDYVRSLEAAKIGVFQAACRTNDGERCQHYDDCPYIAQYHSSDMLEETRGNVIRIFVHSHLGLPRNPLQGDPDLVIIDEAFLDQVISTDVRLSPAEVKRWVSCDKHPKLGRRIVEALEDCEPLLKLLRDEGVSAADLDAIDLEALRPNVTFTANLNRAVNPGGDAGLYRSITTFLRLLREELAQQPPSDHAERVVYDPKHDEIRLAFVKDLDIPETAAVLLLDATADAHLLEQVLGPVTVERIDVSQRAVITQAYDRAGSKAFWKGDTAPVDELVSIANAWAEFGERPLIVSHKELADLLREDAGLRSDVEVMHFQALRGSNAAEDCGVIFITGRNMPPPPEIDLKARALFWGSAEPLQHDEFGSFRPAGVEPVTIPTQFRGYVQSSRNPHPQSGVHVPSFSDARIDALVAQSRDAETMQALGRLRLVHAKYQKRVFLLSNLPVEVPVDRLVPFTDLMPDRLELELIRRGNVPLTPLGLVKMRPDLAANRNTASNLIRASMLANAQTAMQAMPILWRTMMVLARFRAGDERKTDHQHLFLGQQMDSDGIAMVGKVPRPEDIQRLLVEGHPDIPGSGWGEIEDLTVDFLHSGIAVQVSKVDLDDADDGEGNGGGHDDPSP